MQAGKNAAASAKAGMDKTKATLQEKAEKMTTSDPVQKEIATEKKEHKKTEAELNKQEARQQNAASKQAESAHSYSTTGTHQTSAMPGQPVTEGVVGSHPLAPETGTGRPSAAHANTGYGTGGAYT